MDATPDRPDATGTRAPVVVPALRLWLRYLVPLTAMSAIALSPVLAIALRAPAPLDRSAASAMVTLGWKLIASAWLFQLVLVGGASAITRGAPSQLRALGGGLVQVLRAIVPCVAVAAAIAIGSLALVVPGLVLLVLLSLTGASRERGLPAPLVDSITVARGQLAAVALAVAGMLALDAAIAVIAHRAWIAALPRNPPAAQLVAARHFVQAIALALVVASPLPATVLAVLHQRGRLAQPAREHGAHLGGVASDRDSRIGDRGGAPAEPDRAPAGAERAGDVGRP